MFEITFFSTHRRWIECIMVTEKRVKITFLPLQRKGEVMWIGCFNYGTVNLISVILVTAHRCMCRRTEEEIGPTVWLPYHRHFEGFFNVSVQVATRGQLFYGYSEKPDLLNRALGFNKKKQTWNIQWSFIPHRFYFNYSRLSDPVWHISPALNLLLTLLAKNTDLSKDF